MPAEKSVSSLNTIIGPGSAFRGDLEMEGLVRVDGFFCGSLSTTGTVVISKRARVEGPIRARVVVVGGIVKGGVYSMERVDLLSGAVIVGDVFTPRLSTEEDAVIHGDCRILGKEAAGQEMEAFIAAHGGFPRGVRESLSDPRRHKRPADAEPWKR